MKKKKICSALSAWDICDSRTCTQTAFPTGSPGGALFVLDDHRSRDVYAPTLRGRLLDTDAGAKRTLSAIESQPVVSGTRATDACSRPRVSSTRPAASMVCSWRYSRSGLTPPPQERTPPFHTESKHRHRMSRD